MTEPYGKILQRFLQEEVRRLVSSVPLHRGSCYLIAVTTGLRRSELGRQRIEDVHLPTKRIRVLGPDAKNRKTTVLPLCSWAAELLERWIGPDTAGRVWSPRRGRKRVGIPTNPTLYRDLRKVGIDPSDWDGRVDFHALRVSCASILNELHVDPSVIQEIMRHATPRLTSDYTKVRQLRLAEAVRVFDVAG